MFSVVLRRSSLTSQKVFQWANPWRRCRTSLAGQCWSSSATPALERSTWGRSPPGFLGTEPLAALSAKKHFHMSAAKLEKRQKPEPPPKELDLLRYDMKDLWKSPVPALYLGFAGLIPFISPALYMAVTESYIPELAYAQLAYGASIVSFLGGVRWGFALPDNSPAKPDWINLANSVVPSLLAWSAMLMAENIVSAAAVVIIGLGISLHYDLSLLPTYPSWFKALRAVLTVVAFFSLLGTLAVRAAYPEKKFFSD